MRVSFELFGILRHAAGTSQVVVEAPEDSTVKEAVDCLVRSVGSGAGRYIVGPDGKPSAIFVVDGDRVSTDYRLAPGDSIRVVLVAGGG